MQSVGILKILCIFTAETEFENIFSPLSNFNMCRKICLTQAMFIIEKKLVRVNLVNKIGFI